MQKEAIVPLFTSSDRSSPRTRSSSAAPSAQTFSDRSCAKIRCRYSATAHRRLTEKPYGSSFASVFINTQIRRSCVSVAVSPNVVKRSRRRSTSSPRSLADPSERLSAHDTVSSKASDCSKLIVLSSVLNHFQSVKKNHLPRQKSGHFPCFSIPSCPRFQQGSVTVRYSSQPCYLFLNMINLLAA